MEGATECADFLEKQRLARFGIVFLAWRSGCTTLGPWLR
jgi:hypothetical protein